MKFINNGTEAVKVQKDREDNLPRGFATVRPGEFIEANADNFIEYYKKVGLTVVEEVEKNKDEKPKDEPKDKPEEKPKDKPKDEKKEPITSIPKTKSSKKEKKK